MSSYLKAYDRYGKLISQGIEISENDNVGFVTVPNLMPHTKYASGSFFVTWFDDIKGFETDKVPVPEFQTQESTNKEFVFYFNQSIVVNPKSAYQIAVDNGFSGTEEEWVKSIKGEKGEKLTFNDLTEEEKQRLAGTHSKPVNSQITSRGTHKPMITFIDDDGRTELRSKWEPILKEKKSKLTVALVTKWVDDKEPTVLQWDEIHEWNQKYGVEFVSHTHEHKHAQQITDEEVEKELKLSHDILQREGLTYNIIVQPFGENTESVRRISRKYYRANVGTKENINTAPLDTFRVNRISLGEPLYTTFEQYKEKIDEAIANNGWIVFKSHSQYESFDENQLQIIRQIIDYAREQQMLEVNVEEGLNYIGNLIDTGDFTRRAQGIDYYVMDRDGKVYSNFGEKNYDTLKYNTVNINTPITDFKDRMTSTVSIVSSNSQGFPNNAPGQLITTKSESLGLSYQLYLPNNSNIIYKRRWDSKTNAWTSFESTTPITKELLTRQYASNTPLDAQSTADVIITNTVLDSMNFNVGDTITATTETPLPPGILYNVFIREKNKICIRYANITSSRITIPANIFNFRITYK